MSPVTSKRPRRRLLLTGKEGLRFAVLIILVAVLGTVFWGVLDAFYGGQRPEPPEPFEDAPVEVTLPPLNRALLSTVKDAEPFQRYQPEPEVYEHLLDCARYIVPGVLTALGLPDNPITVKEVQANPEKFRGRPVAFEGELFGKPGPSRAIPGISDFKKTEGFLQTDSGQRVYFAVIAPIPEDIRPGTKARIEGFFFKLRDFQFPEKLERVPHVVGFELRHAFGTFEPVKELDPKVLAPVNDAVPRPGDIPRQPLYHLASYVQNKPQDEEWKKARPLLGYDDARNILKANGEVPRGKFFRVLGELYVLQIKLAEPNPLGIRYWTRAWVKHKHAETIQVDIPGRVPGGWKTGDFVVFYGSFFKRHWYEGGHDPKRPGRRTENIVPLFLASQLYHWKLVDNPSNLWIRITLAGITLLLIGLVAMLVIRDSRADQEVRRRLLERRKKNRGR